MATTGLRITLLAVSYASTVYIVHYPLVCKCDKFALFIVRKWSFSPRFTPLISRKGLFVWPGTRRAHSRASLPSLVALRPSVLTWYAENDSGPRGSLRPFPPFALTLGAQLGPFRRLLEAPIRHGEVAADENTYRARIEGILPGQPSFSVQINA